MGEWKVNNLWGENFKDFAISLMIFELWSFYSFYFASTVDGGNFYVFFLFFAAWL